MKWSPTGGWSRSRLLRTALIAPAAAVFAACTGKDTSGGAAGTAPAPNNGAGQAAAIAVTPAQPAGATQAATPAGTPVAQVLQATPACGDDDDEPTPAQTEGPYFTPNSPERTSLLEPGMPGRLLTVSGYVLTTECQPVAGALIDFWQADDAGQYDNVGYRLRGHQFTDETGRYELETVVPGLYPGRTRHIHVKVQAPGGAVLTTQQYFPNEPRNARDGIYRPELEMAVTDNADGSQSATFTYVLAG
jgi:protocatechuate 3,4-dioxygenase beta subunit